MKNFPNLPPEQIANFTPEQRAKYEQFVKMRMSGAVAGGQMQGPGDNLARLRTLGQEEARQSQTEILADIPMSPQELTDTSNKLQRIVVDMSKIGRGLSKWYSITRDDARAKMFFRTRLRIIKQFKDGEKMSQLKPMFSIRASEIDQARAMLESMAKDLAASVYGQRMMKQNSQQHATPQVQNVQLAQQQQQQQPPQVQQQPQQLPQQQPRQQPQQQAPQGNQSAPLNATNLEKNNKANQKAASKNQTPVAPTTAQPPFQFGALSPHGNPSYGNNKAKEMNLQIPPARKKQKVSGQTPQGATPSPQLSKKSSPEARRASESQAPPKPVFSCKEPDCEMSAVGFSTEKLLQKHVLDEHTKPREDPMKFVQENLALALGLEADGTPKKDQKSKESAPGMSTSMSKQGSTPASTGTALKRTASGLSKTQDGKEVGKSEMTPKYVDAKATDASTPAAFDPWASSTIDPQTLMGHLSVEPGLRTTIPDLNLYRSLTPGNDDTPESSKDSGASEPNSDISEHANLDMDFAWNSAEVDLLLNMDGANLDENLPEGGNGRIIGFKEMWDILEPPAIVPDWEDVSTDFSKPFELDTRHYKMGMSYN